ncbi:MAG TPA: ABC transporter permease subunit [Verrucomicrobiae bacterium]|jgi:ABC-type transport system involved in cytochrome c biogenesis permease component|nr:ABC transporter permease subunit [Verrucomicrobiae bacterium]
MTLLPVVERELRVAARRRGTYWSRLTAAVGGWAVAAWTLLAASNGSTQNGAIVFRILAALVFVYAALAGILTTCDCLSEEKREGTLGLLFLTDLRGYDVVFGKLASTSVKTIHGVLAVAPVLAVSLVLGAVTGGEVARVVLVSVNLLFFFLSVGLFASSVCRLDNRSLGLAVILSVLWLTVIPVVARLDFLHIANPDVAFIFSPVFGCFSALENMYNRFPHPWFWLNFLLTQIYGWSLLFLTCWIVPRSWQDSSAGKQRRSLVKVKSVRGTGERKEVLAVNVFLWRAAQPGLQRTVVWLALLAIALMWFALDSILPVARFDVTKDILTLILAGVVVKAWLASEACSTLSADRRNAAMELLLTTPLPEKEIIKGQRLALWRQFAEPASAIFLANILLLGMEILNAPPGSNLTDYRNLLVGLHVITGASLLVDLLALSWTGMWQGLVQRKPNRAAALALVQILLVPYLLFFAFDVMGSGGIPNAFSVLIFTNILGFASAFFFAQNANTRLVQWFRRVVAEGVAPSFRAAAAEEEATPALEGAE